jgi:2-iminobutanoate/2-iminopropanoate deaminase
MRKVKKEVIDVPGVSKHLKKEGIPLSPVIRAGNFVFVSGLTPMDRRTGRIPLVTVDKQARMVLENMKVCLEAAGSSLENVVKCTVYITNTAYFDEVNKSTAGTSARTSRRACSAWSARGRRSSTSRSTA